MKHTPLESKYRIDPSGCWVWMACILSTGYGQVRHNGKMELAHRVIYSIHVGEPPKGLHLDHLCRNRACVNPAHLEAVTCKENTRRGVNGKLTTTLVLQIREDFHSGKPAKTISKETGVSVSRISEVVHGKCWTEVGGPIASVDSRTTDRFIKQRVATRLRSKGEENNGNADFAPANAVAAIGSTSEAIHVS